jgi:hypothetical protein
VLHPTSDQVANSQRNAKALNPFADWKAGSALPFWAQHAAPTLLISCGVKK